MADDIVELTNKRKTTLTGLIKQIRDALKKMLVTVGDVTRDKDILNDNLLFNGNGRAGTITTTAGNEQLKNFLPSYESYDAFVGVVEDMTLLDGMALGYTTRQYTYIGTTYATQRNRIFSVDPLRAYKGKGTVLPSAVSAGHRQRLYVGLGIYDYNGSRISVTYSAHHGLAKLAQDLVLGTDTYMYITREGFQKDASGNDIPPHTEWDMDVPPSGSHVDGLILWDHHHSDRKIDSVTGREIPFTRLNWTPNPNKPAGFGYSRHLVDNLWALGADFEHVGSHNGYTDVYRVPIKTDIYDSVTNTGGVRHLGEYHSPDATITTIPEGTWCSRKRRGNTYKYPFCPGTIIEDAESFHLYEGYIGGMDYSGVYQNNAFPPGMAGVTFLMLGSYGPGSRDDPDDRQYHSNLSLREDGTVTVGTEIHGVIPEHTKPVFTKEINGSQTTFPVNTLTKTKRTTP